MDIVLGIVINKDFANARTLEQLLVYERRIESSLYRAIAELKKIKYMRKGQEKDVAWTSSESHPHSEKDIQNEDATRSQNATCTNEPNFEKIAWAEAYPTGLVARDSYSESGLYISTNEPNLKGEVWHPQAKLGDGLDIVCHAHSEKDNMDKDVIQDTCTNEANLIL